MSQISTVSYLFGRLRSLTQRSVLRVISGLFLVPFLITSHAVAGKTDSSASDSKSDDVGFVPVSEPEETPGDSRGNPTGEEEEPVVMHQQIDFIQAGVIGCTGDVYITYDVGNCEVDNREGGVEAYVKMLGEAHVEGEQIDSELDVMNQGGAYKQGDTWKQPKDLYYCNRRAKTIVTLVPDKGELHWLLTGKWAEHIDYELDESRFVSQDSWLATKYNGNVTLETPDSAPDEIHSIALEHKVSPKKTGAPFSATVGTSVDVGSTVGDSVGGSLGGSYGFGTVTFEGTYARTSSTTGSSTASASLTLNVPQWQFTDEPPTDPRSDTYKRGGKGAMTLTFDRTVIQAAKIAPDSAIAELHNSLVTDIVAQLGPVQSEDLEEEIETQVEAQLRNLNQKPRTLASMGGESWDEAELVVSCPGYPGLPYRFTLP